MARAASAGRRAVVARRAGNLVWRGETDGRSWSSWPTSTRCSRKGPSFVGARRELVGRGSATTRRRSRSRYGVAGGSSAEQARAWRWSSQSARRGSETCEAPRAACEELRPGASIALEGHGLEHVIVDAVGSIRARSRQGAGRPLLGRPWPAERDPRAARPRRPDLLAGSPGHAGERRLVSGGRSVNTIAAAAESRRRERSTSRRSRSSRRGSTPRGRRLRSRPSTELGRRPAGRLARDPPLLATVRAVRRSSVSRTSSVRLDGRQRGPRTRHPCLALGVANGSGMHTLEERIDAGSLARAPSGRGGARAPSGRLTAAATPDRLALVSDISSGDRGGDGNGSAGRGVRVLSEEHGLLIGGEEVSRHGERFDVVNPATGEVIATAPSAGPRTSTMPCGRRGTRFRPGAICRPRSVPSSCGTSAHGSRSCGRVRPDRERSTTASRTAEALVVDVPLCPSSSATTRVG